jgi:hypothetical protein
MNLPDFSLIFPWCVCNFPWFKMQVKQRLIIKYATSNLPTSPGATVAQFRVGFRCKCSYRCRINSMKYYSKESFHAQEIISIRNRQNPFFNHTLFPPSLFFLIKSLNSPIFPWFSLKFQIPWFFPAGNFFRPFSLFSLFSLSCGNPVITNIL